MRVKLNGALIGMLLMIAFLFTSGCGALMGDIAPEAKPFAAYQKSLEIFNKNQRAYLDTRVMMSAETQAKWKVDIEPIFDTASDALDAWGLVLAGGLSDAIAKAEYDKLYTQLLTLLLKYKIVEVK